MKKQVWLLAALSLLFLSACKPAAEPVWETVDDLDVVQTVGIQDTYTMVFDVPMDAVMDTAATQSGRTVYEQKDGDYEIVCETFPASGIEGIVRRLTGFEKDKLDVIETTRFGLPEYRFAWCSDSEEGSRVCRADVIFEAPYCYALTFSVREDAASRYHSTQEQTFASMSLFTDEGF